jgi:hypothetical protein
MRIAPALALMLWAGVASSQVALEVHEDPGPGYPPKMGRISGTLAGKPVAWETYDFSIGAFDASAWADRDWETKAVTARLTGYKPGDPDEMRQRIHIRGGFGLALRTGAAEAPLVEILRGKDFDGPRLSSKGQRAEVVIDSIGPKVEGSYSRQVTGRASARLCPVEWLFKSCQDIEVTFDTQMQMGTEMAITP